MENRIIRMTQDLLDRGYELNKDYIYGIKCFAKNVKIMAENNDPVKKAKNLNSGDWEARACTRLHDIDEEPDTSMNLVLETPAASDEISNDLTPDPPIKYGPQGLLIHSTGAAQSSAQSNVNTFNSVLVTDSAGKVQSVKAVYKGTHAFVAPNDIVQCLPWNFMAHHCAGFFNYTHIGLDLVEPDKDEPDKEKFVLDTYETMVELAAYLCGQYKLDPMGFTEYKVPGKNKTLSVPVILSHKEAHALGGASNHGDPDKMWKAIKIGGVALTMDKFRADVNNR